MSFDEMKQLLPKLTPAEVIELQDCLGALQEGVSVEEFRAIRAALEEEINDPSPELTAEQVEAELKNWELRNAPRV